MTILGVFAMSIIPFAVAWYLAEHPQILHLGSSNGDLITPPVTTESSEFLGMDAFSTENLKELPGHWLLINLLPQSECNPVCQDALYKSRQLSLMMGKDIVRIRRVAIQLQKTEHSILTGEWLEDARLLKILAGPTLREKLLKISGDPASDGMLLLMDPLGNLMMRYPVGFDPYRVKNDLAKLLRISQIG